MVAVSENKSFHYNWAEPFHTLNSSRAFYEFRSLCLMLDDLENNGKTTFRFKTLDQATSSPCGTKILILTVCWQENEET